MKVLLAVACLMAVGFAQREPLKPGAKKGSFLYKIQHMCSGYFTANGELASDYSTWFNLVTNDFCSITDVDRQAKPSVFLGKTCKGAFVELYDVQDKSNQCGGGVCRAAETIRDRGYSFIEDLMAVRTDANFFQLIEDKIVTPIMEYSCRCTNKMMGAWLDCKDDIGEASVWQLLMISEQFDLSAKYLGGRNFKDYWVDVVKELPWDDLSAMLNRINDNMCQDNTQGKGQCYNYFYDTVTTLYRWYLLSDGQEFSVRKRGKPEIESYCAESCSKFDLSVVMNEEASFNDIKNALVGWFCNAECSGLYQEVLLGCCAASMITDNELEDAIKNSVEVIKEIYMSAYEDEAEETRITIDEYFGYYDDAMSKLRDPTCENGRVSYDVTPCDQLQVEEIAGDGGRPCEGLSGKKLKKCRKDLQIKLRPSSGPCEGLSGKKLKKCQKTKAGKGGRVGKYKGKGAKICRPKTD